MLAADVPGDFASSRVSCWTPSGRDVVMAVDLNQASLSLAAGEDVSCDWSIVPDDARGEDPLPTPEAIDADGDRLRDDREQALGTEPLLADTDADGLGDGDEVDLYGTDPLRADTDDDGLDDAEEIANLGTNPLLADTDGDGVLDAEEIAAGSDPIDGASLPATPTPIPTSTPSPTLTPVSASPVSSLATPPEPVTEATPLPTSTPRADLDGDGLATADEVAAYHTNPAVIDSDGDGVGDGDEVAAGTDPLNPNDE